MKTNTLHVATPGDLDIVMTRVFHAPRQFVFDAWTRPELLRRWYGPPEWELTSCDIDLRVGGTYRFESTGPGGALMVQHGTYREIDEPGRMVATEIMEFDGFVSEPSLNTWELIERDGRTTLTITMAYASAEIRREVLTTNMEQGITRSFERLDVVLADVAPDPEGGAAS